MTEAALEVRDLTVRRQGRALLEGVSLAVPARSMVGVLGPNGAGKTTLLSALAGFIRPSAGSVRVLGRDLSGLSFSELRALRERVGLLPQLSEVNELMPLSAREVVEIGRVGRAGPGRRLGSRDRAMVDHALEVFGLRGLSDRPYPRLSGGERRKVQLARVFAQEPELLLLDEPMSNLDAGWQDALRRELQGWWELSGLSMVMVTHELHHLPPSCKRLALLSLGRVIASGPPAKVLDPELLSSAYGRGVKIAERDGRTYLLGAGP